MTISILKCDIAALSGTSNIPDLIERAGASRRFVEFFAAQLRNQGTRVIYARAIARFLTWCEVHELELTQISPLAVASYVEQLSPDLSPPTIKQQLSAIRSLFDFLATGGHVPFNPASAVRGPRHVVKKGKTPVLSAKEARQLIAGINTSTVSGLRDRALIGMMVFSFARVSAVVSMNLADFFHQAGVKWFRFYEKGSKHHEVPAHHRATEYLRAYIEVCGKTWQPNDPLFRTVGPKRQLTPNRMHRVDVYRMIQRRAKQVALVTPVCCHTFRATGITAYLKNGGRLEVAQRIACHESVRTTKLYDRTSDTVHVEEIERIVI